MKRFVIDGNKVVLSVTGPDTRVDDAEFEENEVYAIDIVTSTGEGKVNILAPVFSFISLGSMLIVVSCIELTAEIGR